MSAIPFPFDNSYARDLQGFYVPWQPTAVPAPRLLFLNHALAEELGLDVASLDGPEGAAVFAGNALPEGAEPIAQAYAGHQFGGFSPKLGDGRAVLLGEVIDRHARRRDIALEGFGAHAVRAQRRRQGRRRADAARGIDRRGDARAGHSHDAGAGGRRHGRAGPAREHAARRGLTRVASSHIRVGTFEFFAARGEFDQVRKLAEYTIARHDPEVADEPQPFLALLESVATRQAALMAQWMNVGFIHGVMNTDNMAISGETIDYGPCAFMEAYDPATV